MALDSRFFNVLVLGFGFMFVFTAFQTMGNIEKIVLDSIAADDADFHGDGYTSLAVIYASFALCNWLAPSAITVTGSRGAMLIGASCYCLFMVTFLWPHTWLLYAASAALGAGAALTWTGQGACLSASSTPQTIQRDSGVFWAMLQTSMFFGNLFVFFQFQGKTHIDAPTRTLVFSVLVGVAAVGVALLFLIRRIDDAGDDELTPSMGALDAFKSALRLFITKDMILLSITFLYTGLELSFFSGVYSPSVGFTLAMGPQAKQLVGLCGICIGIGEVVGGVTFGLLGSRTSRWGRDPIVMMGYVVHAVAFFLCFMNLPDSAPFGDTADTPYLTTPRPELALLCALMLGLGDACFNTQIYAMLGGSFSTDSASAFALFKFTQSVAAAASFVYSSYLGLRVQLLILVIFGTAGTACFCAVEWRSKAKPSLGLEAGDSPITSMSEAEKDKALATDQDE